MSHILPGVDIVHFQNYWKEQQKTAVHMDRDQVLAAVETFIRTHDTCGFATGSGDFIRCTPMEYIYMDGCFYFYSEGGEKFIGLETNPNVSLCIYEYHGDPKDSHGLQCQGTAEIFPPRCDLFKKVLEFKGIPYDVVKAYQVDVCLIKITPKVFEMYNTDFVAQGYDIRQTVRLD